MPAQTSVQQTHGMGEDAFVTVSAADAQAQGKRKAAPAHDRDDDTPRVSPDPMQGTDRYRLVMPFNLRL